MVEVYARAAKVALKINGKTVGEAAPKNDCVVRFSCTYEDGTVEAVSYDAAGNEIGCTALHTANTETRLCLVPEEETVRPGGLAFVQLRYTDENGTVKSLERGTVTVKVRGGTLLGWAAPVPTANAAICPIPPIPISAKRWPWSVRMLMQILWN